jgi:hypothetical protein
MLVAADIQQPRGLEDCHQLTWAKLTLVLLRQFHVMPRTQNHITEHRMAQNRKQG